MRIYGEKFNACDHQRDGYGVRSGRAQGVPA
jgi:hypothetical protein